MFAQQTVSPPRNELGFFGVVTLANGSATVTIASGRTPGVGVAKNLNITFAGSFVAADTYSDTLTLTITGN